MRWLMDVCPNNLGWQAWLVLCVVVVVLWAVAIAGATALFHASGRPRRTVRGIGAAGSQRPGDWIGLTGVRDLHNGPGVGGVDHHVVPESRHRLAAAITRAVKSEVRRCINPPGWEAVASDRI